jgi:hypothetical protein
MNNYGWYILFNHSLVLAAVIGIIRYRFIVKSFRPFLFFIWLGIINESVSLVLILTRHSNAVNSNIYVLLEFAVLLLQFYKWNDNNGPKYLLILLTGTIVWVTDNILLHALTDNNSLFRIFYSIVIVLFSIDLVNRTIVFEKDPVYKNALFLIGITFIVFYGHKTFLEVFNIFSLPLSNIFYKYIWLTMSFINFIANIIFAIAILCIPKKEEFFMRYLLR